MFPAIHFLGPFVETQVRIKPQKVRHAVPNYLKLIIIETVKGLTDAYVLVVVRPTSENEGLLYYQFSAFLYKRTRLIN